MSNTEWKNGYEEGFAAGWKAANDKNNLNYTNFPPVYYTTPPTFTTGQFSTFPDNYTVSIGNKETPKKKANLRVIRNLTDHTEIV